MTGSGWVGILRGPEAAPLVQGVIGFVHRPAHRSVLRVVTLLCVLLGLAARAPGLAAVSSAACFSPRHAVCCSCFAALRVRAARAPSCCSLRLPPRCSFRFWPRGRGRFLPGSLFGWCRWHLWRTDCARSVPGLTLGMTSVSGFAPRAVVPSPACWTWTLSPTAAISGPSPLRFLLTVLWWPWHEHRSPQPPVGWHRLPAAGHTCRPQAAPKALPCRCWITESFWDQLKKPSSDSAAQPHAKA